MFRPKSCIKSVIEHGQFQRIRMALSSKKFSIIVRDARDVRTRKYERTKDGAWKYRTYAIE